MTHFKCLLKHNTEVFIANSLFLTIQWPPVEMANLEILLLWSFEIVEKEERHNNLVVLLMSTKRHFSARSLSLTSSLVASSNNICPLFACSTRQQYLFNQNSSITSTYIPGVVKSDETKDETHREIFSETYNDQLHFQ